MNKIKNIVAFAIVGLLIYSCDSSTSIPVDNFDHEAQALIDDDTLVQFFKNHYYDTSVDSVKALVDGKTALYQDINSMNVTENDIDYTLYYYLKSEGNPSIDKGNPTVMDSVFVKYYGQRIVRSDSISSTFDNNDGIWFTLNSVIRGWSHGFTNFKGGDNITNNGPITFENGGSFTFDGTDADL